MGSLFTANLYFWALGGDYFAPDIHGNPLLHLWSLSVEEQFYLFIPFLFIMVWKLRREWLFPVVLLLTIISFAGAVHSVWEGSAGNAFYLPHFRAWELLVGSLLAMIPQVLEERWGHKWLSGLGLLLILFSYGIFTSETPFPGLSALPSVLGAGLLVRYGSSGWVSQALSCRSFIGIGKISYSLYLWHWPVMVFWKYATYNQLYFLDYIGMLSASFFLGYLSWRFVELPVRMAKGWTQSKSFVLASSGVCVLVSLGIACVFSKGWGNTLHRSANELIIIRKSYFVENLIRYKSQQIGSAIGIDFGLSEPFQAAFTQNGDWPLGIDGDPEILLIGDSHASALHFGFDSYLQSSGVSGFRMSRGAKAVCNLREKESSEILVKLRKSPEISKVVLAQYWRSYAGDLFDTEATYADLEEFAYAMQSMGKTLFVLADVPVRGYDPRELLVKQRIIPERGGAKGRKGVQSIEEYSELQGQINLELEMICKKTGAVFVPMHEALKFNNQYIAFHHNDGSLVPLYLDSNHLSPEGSLLAAKFLMPYIFPDTE